MCINCETAIDAAKCWDEDNDLTDNWIENELEQHGISIDEFNSDPEGRGSVHSMYELYCWLGY